MKAIYAVLILVCPILLSAQNRNDLDYYAKMLEINSQWRFHQADCPKERIQFDSDIDAIQAHLYLVCVHLTKNTAQSLNENQRAKRMQLIEELRNYAHEKVFPTNLYHATRTPYFVDDFGVHCAVGFLMKQSGFTDLVATIRANENYAYIEEIRTPGVAEWAEEHGFTVDELKWIQPSYLSPPQHRIFPIGDGVNNKVTHLVSRHSSSPVDIIVAGGFDSLGGIPCLNIGRFAYEQFSCLGDGINGLINSVSVRNGSVLYAFGQFFEGNEIYTIATYNFSQGEWDYMNIPSREGYVASSGKAWSWSNLVTVSVQIPDGNGEELWFYNIVSNTWSKKLFVNGTVVISDFTNLGYGFGGSFDTVTFYNENNEVIDQLNTTNVLFYQSAQQTWSTLTSSHICDTVKCIVQVNNQTYFGGSAINNSTSSGVVLSRYLNNVLQPVILASSFVGDSTVSINAISITPDGNALIFAGNFYFSHYSAFGRHIGQYNVIQNNFLTVDYLDKPVYTLSNTTQQLFVGGSFNSGNFSSGDLNGFGRITSLLSVDDFSNHSFSIYPNPFTDIIQVQGIDIESDFRILDTHGRVVHQGTIHGDTALDLSDLSTGVYMLHVTSDSGNVVRRIVKQ